MEFEAGKTVAGRERVHTDEVIVSPDGIHCAVLDADSLEFGSNPTYGRKAAKTLVRTATGGEVIETKNSEGKI